MYWSRGQETALDRVLEWRRKGQDPIFRLFGYAGTGKTTLAKHIAQEVGGRVLFAAYTGKAAHVLRQNGCLNATTIHSLCYLPIVRSRNHLIELQKKLKAETDPVLQDRLQIAIEDEKARLRRPAFQINEDSDLNSADLLIVDECSMVDERMGHDLLSFGCPILVLGDPGQLPPIRGGGYFTSVEPDACLTEIHRQARDNPIIDLATRAREGKPIPLGTYGESRVILRSELKKADALGHDQTLVGKNVTRRSVNMRFRSLLGRSSVYPEPGDRLVCLRNNHQLGLLNGAIWNTISCFQEDDRLDVIIEGEDDAQISTEIHCAPFEGEDVPFWEKRDAQEFDFGYALTVHKSQGSQWSSVLLFDESMCFGRDRRNWMYTGITRAADRITIVRG